MKRIIVMNGWRDAPHLWRHYWKVSRNEWPDCWVSYSFAGFAVFFLK